MDHRHELLMNAYEISPNSGATPTYAGDLAAVRAKVRLIPKASRDYARITLVSVPADKAAVLQLLNGKEPVKQPLRKWRLSVRGRLVEIPLGEEE
jgi:hypothetical protein